MSIFTLNRTKRSFSWLVARFAFIHNMVYSGITQLVECEAVNFEVLGSSPSTRAIPYFRLMFAVNQFFLVRIEAGEPIHYGKSYK